MLAGWRAHMAWSRRMDEVRKRVVQRLLQRAMAGAFGAWAAWVLERQRTTTLFAKAAKRMQNASMAAALSRWVEWTQQYVRSRELAARVLARMQRGALSAALGAWVAHVEEKQSGGPLAAAMVAHGVVVRYTPLAEPTITYPRVEGPQPDRALELTEAQLTEALQRPPFAVVRWLHQAWGFAATPAGVDALRAGGGDRGSRPSVAHLLAVIAPELEVMCSPEPEAKPAAEQASIARWREHWRATRRPASTVDLAALRRVEKGLQNMLRAAGRAAGTPVPAQTLLALLTTVDDEVDDDPSPGTLALALGAGYWD